ncbi:MAG: hypothetical protein KIS61_29190 [Candidatus Eremiobacteraeota bacterium]|nr:hypothetical protein [Candidatus Eremiobacteraeota bacterium]
MRICLLLLLLTLPVLACLNETEKDLNGNDVPVEAGPGSYELPSFYRDWKEELAGHEHKLKANPHDRGARNDRGVCLAHLGRSREALALFQQLEREAPGVYGTAANMGTCYELCGRDEDALYWIRESIHRNPDAHQGTEWLHVKILEAKLALAQDPNWLQSHSVLGMDFGSKVRPHYPRELSTQVARDRVRKALRYQLGERMPLVPPPDPVVADLLFDLANLAALMQSAHRGEEVMQEALRYGPPLKSLAKKRLAYFGSFDKKEEPAKPKPKSGAKKSPPAAAKQSWWRPALAVLAILSLLLGIGRLRR